MTLERFRIATSGDLEAVLVAETFDLLGDLFGPYCFEVSGLPGQQQVVFTSAASHTLFFIRVHEFVAEATDLYVGEEGPRNLSLLEGGGWLITKHPGEARRSGWDLAHEAVTGWLDEIPEFEFWSGALERHLSLRGSFRRLLAPQSHFSKHTLIKLGREVERFRSMCHRAGCSVTISEAVAAREEFSNHLDGMMRYYSTWIAELLGKYFVAFHKVIVERYRQNPTNNLDLIRPPEGISDETFRYLYASSIVSCARWTEERIARYVPETASTLRQPYRP